MCADRTALIGNLHVGELFERVAQIVGSRIVLRDNHNTCGRISRVDAANVVDECIQPCVARFVAQTAVNSTPRALQIGVVRLNVLRRSRNDWGLRPATCSNKSLRISRLAARAADRYSRVVRPRSTSPSVGASRIGW